MKDAENPARACCLAAAGGLERAQASAYLTYPDPAGASLGSPLLYRAVLSGQSPAGSC